MNIQQPHMSGVGVGGTVFQTQSLSKAYNEKVHHI